MYHAINAHGNGNNVVNAINTTKNNDLKEQMELIGKLTSKDTSHIGIITSESKDGSINFE